MAQDNHAELNKILSKLSLRSKSKVDNKVNNFYINNSKNNYMFDNLKKYLTYYMHNPPKYILIGEAPGYKGCAKSGIPFTSQYIISNVDFFKSNFQLLGGEDKERTSTIMWNFFKSVQVYPLLWNAFPFHPHNINSKKYNRKPNMVELKEGLEYINILKGIFPSSELIAVGNVANESLQSLGLKFNKVRHPSFGGAAQFKEQMSDLLK